MLTAIKGFSLEGADHSESMVPVAGRGEDQQDWAVHIKYTNILNNSIFYILQYKLNI